MKTFVCLGAICFFTFSSCSVISSSTLVGTPSLDSAVVKSAQLGGNFAYSTVQTNAYAPLHLQYAIPQTIYNYPFLHPSVINSPIYGGLFGHPALVSDVPSIAQHPIFGYPGQTPIQAPVQTPIQSPIQNPIQSPIQSPIIAPPGGALGDAPAGATVDEDTVSVEAAY